MSTALLDDVQLAALLRLGGALVAGGLIGLERSYHGRAAGFRTHALVCLSTSLLMLITVFEARWFPVLAQGRVTLDPTRVAQGIMTGIGFLGAGAIIREGTSVRGLTTAASIWITSAIGILIGVGFYFPAIAAVILTLGTLSLFRWIENLLPVHFYAQFVVRFAQSAAMPEAEVRRLVVQHGFKATKLTYRLDSDAAFFEYAMTLHARQSDKARALSETLAQLPTVKAFQISPTGD
jgi:putative Mg2+ transporter-C (MgtC) family protein